MEKGKIKGFVFSLILFLIFQGAYSQKAVLPDSLFNNVTAGNSLKPQFHYSIGSAITIVPHTGSMSGITFTPSVFLPLSSRLSVEGGIIAGRFYSTLPGFKQEGIGLSSFNELSVYGLATYRVTPQFTVFGSGIKQVTGSSSLYTIPKSIYTIGSSYNFGSFSIGLTLRMAKQEGNFNAFPFNSSQGFGSPFMNNLYPPVQGR